MAKKVRSRRSIRRVTTRVKNKKNNKNHKKNGKAFFTKKDLSYFKGQLLRKKQELLEQIRRIEVDSISKTQKDASGDISSYTLHMADIASDNYDREFNLELADNVQKILYAIEESLNAITANKYKKCSLCGKWITKKRLKAIPYANACIDCQKNQESSPIPAERE